MLKINVESIIIKALQFLFAMQTFKNKVNQMKIEIEEIIESVLQALAS